MASSSSVRVSRTSPRKPRNCAGSEVTLAEDSRSLAARHSARRWVSEPMAGAGGVHRAAGGQFGDHVGGTAWSIRSPEKSRCRTLAAIG